MPKDFHPRTLSERLLTLLVEETQKQSQQTFQKRVELGLKLPSHPPSSLRPFQVNGSKYCLCIQIESCHFQGKNCKLGRHVCSV
jgi:hypothetical protein